MEMKQGRVKWWPFILEQKCDKMEVVYTLKVTWYTYVWALFKGIWTIMNR